MSAGPPAHELPFVGRETSLGALVSAVQAAELGERVLGLIAGEPGIGKTRLLREVARRVSSRVVWGTCWDGDGAPPFWVWRQLLRSLGGEASSVESRLAGDTPTDTDQATRFRLFDKVAEACAAASRHEPAVLVLEDLHWADEPSVRLLEFLARDQRPRRLAIFGTYRDTDLTAAYPFARRLGDLAREALQLSLGGLGKRDVGVLLSAAGDEGADLREIVPILHRRSGGNPFFLRELVRLWRDEGRLGDRATELATAVPAGIRPVVASRLAQLAPSTRDVLAVAATVGAEFEVALVADVTGSSTSDVLAALDDARSAGLVAGGAGSRPGTFAFLHALVREVLYDELSLARRATLHRKIATVIELQDGGSRLPEIAHHVLAGAVEGDDARAVELAVRAAEHTASRLAYEEAAAWYGRALGAATSLPPDDPRRAELHLSRGEAQLAAGDMAGARESYLAAAGLARRRGDADQLARAALGLGTGFGGFEVQLLDPVQVELLEEALSTLGGAPSRLRAWVLARLSVALSFLDAEPRRLTLSEQAVAMARTVGDDAALGHALAGHADAIAGPDHIEARRDEADEVIALALGCGDRRLELLGRRLRVVALLELGDMAEADAEIERFAQAADHLRQPLYRWYVPLWRAMRALMRRDLASATRQRAIAERIGEAAHSHNARFLTFTQWWVQQRYEGRFVEAGQAMAGLVEPDEGKRSVTPAGWPYASVIAAQLGEVERAGALLDEWLAAGLSRRVRDSEWLPESAQLAEVAILAGRHQVAELLYDQLRPYAHRFCVEGIGAACTGSVAWYLGKLARFLGRPEAATYEGQAIAAHRSVGLVDGPPPLAGGEQAVSGVVGPTGAAIAWEGATWAVTYGGTTRRLPDSKGIRNVVVLLARPGEEVHCLELVGGTDVGGDAGPVIDPQARRAYERRIRELQHDIDEAGVANDPMRAEAAEAELDALVQQLSEAFGLSGRARATGSASERARSAVGWRVRAALRHAAEAHPGFARHLQNSVRTGTWCSYRPEIAVTWEITGPDPDGYGRRA